jgi:hypothetical protein
LSLLSFRIDFRNRFENESDAQNILSTMRGAL